MAKEHPESKYLRSAREMLASIQRPLSLIDREEKAKELASYILSESRAIMTREEKKKLTELSRMMQDPVGRAFISSLMDQCFRSHFPVRIAEQVTYLLNLFGIPQFLSPIKRFQFHLFKSFGMQFPQFFVPMLTFILRKQTSSVIISGEKQALTKHVKKRMQEGVQLNINHLGEDVLGEKEAERRLKLYLGDLENDLIHSVSIKMSTLYSQINLLSYENTLEKLAERLRLLYRAAMKKAGATGFKFINLDMEKYQDLHLTKDLFIKVLSEPEFHPLTAGIALQAYLPDSYGILKELTEWAMKRVEGGGAPIKIRIVKGANMAMEHVEASIKEWPQAPYHMKIETDANFKRMLLYSSQSSHAKAVHIGVATHNLFEISFAMLLRMENRIEKEMSFEMLEGMADHMRRVVQALTENMVLYCAVATKVDFHNTIAYLFRRLDENMGEENFLHYSIDLKPGSKEWNAQTASFSTGCEEIERISNAPRRTQNRLLPPVPLDSNNSFENEPDTDFSLPQNREWSHQIVEALKKKEPQKIPLMIGGKEIHHPSPEGIGYDPSFPEKEFYTYTLANWEEIDQALCTAIKEEKKWALTSVDERCELLRDIAQILRIRRADFIATMVADGGKLIPEADTELSEAIDFAEYYSRSMLQFQNYRDIEFSPKGTILIAPPWNFPISIPVGGICAALITGNCVLFKPAPESILCGWELVNALWEAGVPKTVLQFINCEEDSIGSKLIQDPRLNTVILTGSSNTAKHFLKLRPGLDLSAETGGKNGMIITALADRDQAIKDLIQSAFGHNGQKCSAASLAILEKEVYDDLHFRAELKDAVESLQVGSAWDLSTKITPLIKEPGKDLLRGLTTLEQGEFWLLEPKQVSGNLWSPGIKLGVQKGSFTQQTELFGPVLGIIRAENFDQAIHIANSTPYGLTSGLHSLDKREQKKWQKAIIAGNCYINRSTTGAIVRRQPFGGGKNSSFGKGSKAGGPNYLTQFMHAKQISIPKEKFPVGDWVNNLTRFLEKFDLSAEDLGIWYASISSYAFFWQQFRKDKDSCKIVGQDNYLRYMPHKKVAFRIGPDDLSLDYLRVFAAALTTETRLEISWEKSEDRKIHHPNWQAMLPIFDIIEEDEKEFIKRIKTGHIKRIRMLKEPSEPLKQICADTTTYVDYAPVLSNGRIELLHYLREVSLSIDYHRYGNLGLREDEIRSPVL